MHTFLFFSFLLSSIIAGNGLRLVLGWAFSAGSGSDSNKLNDWISARTKSIVASSLISVLISLIWYFLNWETFVAWCGLTIACFFTQYLAAVVFKGVASQQKA